jgi:hypothetical protein
MLSVGDTVEVEFMVRAAGREGERDRGYKGLT